jgi:hypothetical protein
VPCCAKQINLTISPQSSGAATLKAFSTSQIGGALVRQRLQLTLLNLVSAISSHLLCSLLLRFG